ncbi:MAG: GNAT family N-acetyltransferase [Agriterribacter sp.]
MSSIRITKASANDALIIQRIAKETFFETFSSRNTEENMQKYLNESFSEKKVMEELNNPDSLFYIAWDNDQSIGYLKLNVGKAQTEIQDDSAIEIERIYVKSEYHGKKIGQLLYEKAIEIALDQKRSYVWLAVWEENPRAIRFYKKNGFIAFDKHIFKLGNDEQIDIMMKKDLPA